jgi:hypothetical protein
MTICPTAVRNVKPSFKSALDVQKVHLLNTIWVSHLLSAVVTVGTSSIPVALNRFWVQRNDHTEFFSHTVQQVSRYPQMVPHVYSFTRSDLELPLGRHDFCVTASNLDSSIQTGTVVGLYYVTSVNFVSSYTAVIWTCTRTMLN